MVGWPGKRFMRHDIFLSFLSIRMVLGRYDTILGRAHFVISAGYI